MQNIDKTIRCINLLNPSSRRRINRINRQIRNYLQCKHIFQFALVDVKRTAHNLNVLVKLFYKFAKTYVLQLNMHLCIVEYLHSTYDTKHKQVVHPKKTNHFG